MAKEKEELSIEERLLRIQEQQLAIQQAQVNAQIASTDVQRAQLKQTQSRSLASPPKISVFNPRGQKDYPMPTLKCELEAAFPMTPTLHMLDREEVELCNLLEPGEFQIEMLDGTQQAVNIIGQKHAIHGTWEKLAIRGHKDPDTGKYMALFTHTNKQVFPAFRVLLRQLLGDRADGVLPIKEEMRRVTLAEDDPKHLPVSVGA